MRRKSMDKQIRGITGKGLALLLSAAMILSGVSVFADEGEGGGDAGTVDVGGGEPAGGDAGDGGGTVVEPAPGGYAGNGGETGGDGGNTGDNNGGTDDAGDNGGNTGGDYNYGYDSGYGYGDGGLVDDPGNDAGDSKDDKEENKDADEPVFEKVEVNEKLEEDLRDSAPMDSTTQKWLARTAANRGSVKETINGRKVIMIGDSRAVGMGMAVDPGAEQCIWSCLGGMGYNWMVAEGVPAIEGLIDSKTDIIISMGVNDAWDGMADEFLPRYVEYLNTKAEEWNARGARTFYVSVNPIRQQFQLGDYLVDDHSVIYWNTYMKQRLSSDVNWIETYSAIRNHVDYADDIHYMDTTYKELYQMMLDASARYGAEEEGVERDVNPVEVGTASEQPAERSNEDSRVAAAPTPGTVAEAPVSTTVPMKTNNNDGRARVLQAAIAICVIGAILLFLMMILVLAEERARKKKARRRKSAAASRHAAGGSESEARELRVYPEDGAGNREMRRHSGDSKERHSHGEWDMHKKPAKKANRAKRPESRGREGRYR